MARRSRGGKKFALGFSRPSRGRLGGQLCFPSFILPPPLGASSPSRSWRTPRSGLNDCLKWTAEHVMPLLKLSATPVPASACSPGSPARVIGPDPPGHVAPDPLPWTLRPAAPALGLLRVGGSTPCNAFPRAPRGRRLSLAGSVLASPSQGLPPRTANPGQVPPVPFLF